MFIYEKHLQYPVRIQNTNPKLASIIISQYGGPYSNRLLSPNINITIPQIVMRKHPMTRQGMAPYL